MDKSDNIIINGKNFNISYSLNKDPQSGIPLESSKKSFNITNYDYKKYVEIFFEEYDSLNDDVSSNKSEYLFILVKILVELGYIDIDSKNSQYFYVGISADINKVGNKMVENLGINLKTVINNFCNKNTSNMEDDFKNRILKDIYYYTSTKTEYIDINRFYIYTKLFDIENTYVDRILIDLDNEGYIESLKNDISSVLRARISTKGKKYINKLLSSSTNNFNMINENFEVVIQQEEGIHLERKSSLQWDYKKNEKNKDLVIEVIKTIAGFANTKGGILIIGQKDNGEILGLKNDYESVNNKNRDGFTSILIDYIGNYFNKSIDSVYSIKYEEIDKKDICIVKINKSKIPILVRGEDFYIRSINRTIKLNKQDMIEYILKHF